MSSKNDTVVDTVGAGDTLDAGVLASLDIQRLLTKEKVANLIEQQLGVALQLGTATAAITVC
ncbi:pfkB family carbohydrate kinase [Agrobacterium vitis]|nr:pfkB family carbohydrate kinase [Agrobacterium vitis]